MYGLKPVPFMNIKLFPDAKGFINLRCLGGGFGFGAWSGSRSDSVMELVFADVERFQ
jgi:hypothetical protein